MADRSTAALDPTALTVELIRCPSVTPLDEGAIPHLRRVLEGLGFACEEFTFQEPGTEPVLNLYARYGKSGRNVCFAGHTDVVPPGPRESWAVDPFSATLKDGVLTGRGAVDMKTAIAAFAVAAQRYIAAQGAGFKDSISFLITGDEEAAAVNGTVKVLEALAKRGEKIDGCVVGEPTSAQELGDMVKIGRRGSLNGKLVVRGVQGHTAYPHLADNAAHRLIAMVNALTTTPIDQGSERFEPTNLQITTIDIGNPAANVIPAQAQASFNVRFNDRWSGKTLEAWIRQLLNKVSDTYELTIRVSGESFLTPPGAVSESLTAAIAKVMGRKPVLSTTGGTSDARFIQAYCPVAEFGLMSNMAHKVNESVNINDIESLTRIYLNFLEFYFKGR